MGMIPRDAGSILWKWKLVLTSVGHLMEFVGVSKGGFVNIFPPEGKIAASVLSAIVTSCLVRRFPTLPFQGPPAWLYLCPDGNSFHGR